MAGGLDFGGVRGDAKLRFPNSDHQGEASLERCRQRGIATAQRTRKVPDRIRGTTPPRGGELSCPLAHAVALSPRTMLTGLKPP